MMSFPYKKILVIGATSGIGEDLASKFVSEGHKVVVVGRRQEKLDQFVQKHGKDKADSMVFDITKLDKILSFVKDVTSAHPDLDCVFMNSGIQRSFNFAKPDTVDLSTISDEFTTNYLSYLHLTNAFLPYLQQSKQETALIYTTSGLALTPMLRCGNYCASKAALHHYILVLREQMKQESPNVKVVEIFPPAVHTELHNEKNQPDIKGPRDFGMPLDEFTSKTWKGLREGKEQIAVGTSEMSFNSWEQERQKGFHKMIEMMAKSQD